MVDDVTRRFLHPNHVVGQQLRAFARHRTRSLHAFPDAFVAVQELSFTSLVERRIEGEHAQVKLAAARGFRWAGPAMVCAPPGRSHGA